MHNPLVSGEEERKRGYRGSEAVRQKESAYDREQRAESREQSREQRAESREQREESRMDTKIHPVDNASMQGLGEDRDVDRDKEDREDEESDAERSALEDDVDPLKALPALSARPQSAVGRPLSAVGGVGRGGMQGISLKASSSRKESFGSDQVYMKAPRIVMKAHSRSVYALGILQDLNKRGTLILSGSEDKMVNVWSLVTGELLATLGGHVQRVSGVVGFAEEEMDPIAVSCGWDEVGV
jgi:hypothetical protein